MAEQVERVERISATPAALALIATLRQRHGDALMFYQSHGCCDGSTPMCLKVGEMRLTSTDVQMGEVGGLPFFVGRTQLEYLQGGPQLIDAKPGGLGTFSLDDGENMHFSATQTRLWTDEESAWLAAHPLV
jgi:uncharacterized protein (DUF779 family)